MSVFSLEALNAKQGDCLLLHWGESDQRRLALIDGGPSGVYERWLAPRLQELADGRGGGPLRLELVLVSHVDDDHIHGVLDLFRVCAEAHDDELASPYTIDRLWHNAFHTLTDPALGGAGASAGASREAGAGEAAVASVGQGMRLEDDARLLLVPINDGDGGLIVTPSAPEPPPGLKLTVISPSRKQLDALRKKWEQEAARRGKPAALATAYSDTSVYNLSSIVVCAEVDGRRMLLTGDARGDDILAGLQAAGLIDGEGILEVDLLKVPHHGSDRNVAPDFFRRIRAKHYVISADGKYGNPEDATLQMILDGREDDKFTLHFTNHEGDGDLGARLDSFCSRAQAQCRKFGVRFREPESLSLVVDLGDGLA
jgi:hypothetical protein